MRLADFEAWLREQGYQPSSVRAYTSAARSLITHGGDALALIPSHTAAVRALLRCAETGGGVTLAVLDEAKAYDVRAMAAESEPQNKLHARRQAQAKRKRSARSIAPDDFERLAIHTWEKRADPACAVLSVLYTTGLRVGDVLGISRGQLHEGRRTGTLRVTTKGGETRILPWAGAPDEWDALTACFVGLSPDLRTVADLLTRHPGSSALPGAAAYQRCNRRLKQLAADVQLDGRIHLHRLRRTVAVRALIQTKDIVAVQQLLGHRSIGTTTKYVDEARPEAVATLQTQIHPRTKRTP